jgi:hypothetical protein
VKEAEITEEQVKGVAERLRKAPAVEKKPRRFTKQAAVSRLHKEIQQLRNRGYTLEQVSRLITQGGIALTPEALRTYLRRAVPAKSQESPAPPIAKRDTPRPPPAAQTTTSAGQGTFAPRPDTTDI